MADLNRIREQLNAIIAEAAAEAAADIEGREAALADAMERASQDRQLRAAFNDGMEVRQCQILAMIDQQLEQLGRIGTNPLALQNLKRRIQDGAA